MKLQLNWFNFLLIGGMLGISFTSCKTGKPSKVNDETAIFNYKGDELMFNASTPPFDLKGIAAKFYQDIPYDKSKETVFDIFLPTSAKPSSLVLFIHGGGFIQGDKKDKYKGENSVEMIRKFLSNNIAFASTNYRLLTPESTQGVLQCLNDSKRALQFIRYYSQTLHINKEKIILMGGSAGAGTSLWIAFKDDMGDKTNADPILRESTRVKGVVATSTQSTYNLPSWNDVVFKEYKNQGFDSQQFGKQERLLNFYGLDSNADPNSPELKAYAEKVDMLALMSNDDPEIYVSNPKPYKIPTSQGEVLHHPLHAKALMDEAAKKTVKGEFKIPAMNINTTNGESEEDFVIRIIGPH